MFGIQGCNVRDIDLVVQWKLLKTLSQWVQRAGRAARAPGHKGLAFLLVERSTYSTNLHQAAEDVPGPTKKKTGTRGKGKESKGAVEGRKRTPKGYAESRGVKRGGSKALDAIVGPPLQPHLIQMQPMKVSLYSHKQPCVGARSGVQYSRVG